MADPTPDERWPRAALLPWTEVKRLAASDAVALLPIGSTEAHGPHLPLNVDVLIAEEVCRRAAALLLRRGRASVTFPAVAYGLTEFAASFSGTVHVRGETVSPFLEEIMVGVASHGFRAIAAVNHHVEPAHFRTVHAAARNAAANSGARIIVPDHRRPPFVERLGPEFSRGGSHAGHYETSLVMAIAPHLVRDDVRRSLPAVDVDLPARIKSGARDFHEAGGPQAYFGNPASASAEAGEAFLNLLADFTAGAVLAPDGT